MATKTRTGATKKAAPRGGATKKAAPRGGATKKAAAPRAATKRVAVQKVARKKAAPPPATAKKSAPAKAATKRAGRKAPARKAAAKPAVVHWEVQARDPAKQQAFFGELFSWRIDANNSMSYGMVEAGSTDGIGGGIGGGSGASLVTVYVQVDDIDSTLAKAESLGAQTIMPRTDIGMIIMAQFRDPEGNVIGLVEG
jgi:predicted enzyme related to lactoylglutathione lyase